MMENVVPAGGQGSVEFDDSAEAGSVESRLALLRALVEDIERSGKTEFLQEITIDGRVWQVRAEQTRR